MSTTGKVATSIEKRDECNLKNAQVDIKNERKIAEIQVFPLVSPETLENDQGRKLLAQRSRSRKQLLPSAQATKITNVKKLVPLDAISCISDYSNMNNVALKRVSSFSMNTSYHCLTDDCVSRFV